MKKFVRKYFASWTDLDPNWHVANHAYIKYAADTRVSFFSELKLDKDKFNNLNIGPVLFYEHMHYYKEIMMGVEFSINVEIDGYSDDGRFFTLFQNFFLNEPFLTLEVFERLPFKQSHRMKKQEGALGSIQGQSKKQLKTRSIG